MQKSSSVVKKSIFNGSLRAIKILSKEDESAQSTLREITIHKSLDHPFIIKYITHIQNETSYNLVLEFAEYNLRNLIIPEIGLDSNISHMIFIQLLEAIKYLHSKGICHRDIKPDNILINKNGNVKLSDFGCSTLFINSNIRRKLKNPVGTVEFMAPEVLKGEYDGQMADIYSMGMTLLNILTGKLPWKMASSKDERYKAYRQMKYHCYDPFNRIRDNTLRLIENMLNPEPTRISLQGIIEDVWINQSNRLIKIPSLECTDSSFLDILENCENLHFTQPEKSNFISISPLENNRKRIIDISQPVQLPNLPAIHRLYLNGNSKDSIKYVIKVLESMSVMPALRRDSIVFNTVDTKRNKLCGEIVIQEINGDDSVTSIVTVKRTRGDLGEFKKFLIFFNSVFES